MSVVVFFYVDLESEINFNVTYRYLPIHSVPFRDIVLMFVVFLCHSCDLSNNISHNSMKTMCIKYCRPEQDLGKGLFCWGSDKKFVIVKEFTKRQE